VRFTLYAWIAVARLVHPGAAAGAPETATVPVTATIDTIFRLVCEPTLVMLHGHPGEVVSNSGSPVRCTVTSNWISDRWRLKLQAAGPLIEVSDPSNAIPIAAFFHRSRCANTCTPANLADAATVPFTLSPLVYYEGGDQERNTLRSPTQIETVYELRIPAGQPAGTYTTTVIHTLLVTP